jgi:hypothetical protein
MPQMIVMPSTGFAEMNAAAPPWDYNPSSWPQRLTIAAIAMVGVLISLYLAAYQWRWVNPVWDPFFGEQSSRVLDSGVSHWMMSWFGIPDAALGALAYLGDVLFGLAGSTRRWQCRPWLVVLFGIDVIPLGLVSAILVLMQAGESTYTVYYPIWPHSSPRKRATSSTTT